MRWGEWECGGGDDGGGGSKDIAMAVMASFNEIQFCREENDHDKTIMVAGMMIMNTI